MTERNRGWNCMDPDGRLNDAFQRSVHEHELMQREPQVQFDPGVLEAGGLIPSVNHEPVQSPNQ